MQRLIQHPFFKFIVWWLLWTSVGAWIVHDFGFSWRLSLVDALVTQTDWTLAGYVVNQMLRNYRPSPKNILNVIFICLALAALFTLVVLPWVLPLLVPNEVGYTAFLDHSLPVRLIMAWMQVLFIASQSWLWYFSQEEQEQKKREQEAEKLVKEAELSQLRQQLQPHFLFNSLNSINALVGTQPQQARQMVQQLSDFLRGTMKKDDRQRITLEEELTHLALYLDIEKVRFGYRLKSEVVSDEASKNLQLPPLLLQPLVENAIKFGLYDTVGEIVISIRAYAADRHLVVEIRNPFDPSTSSPKQGTGFGLSSIARRLYLIYSQNNLLTTTTEENTFITTIKIPQL
jgi:hypothetical protein